MRRRRRKPWPPSRPWTAEEEEKLRQVNEIGLASDFWHLALPDRSLREMIERRYELGIKPARYL